MNQVQSLMGRWDPTPSQRAAMDEMQRRENEIAERLTAVHVRLLELRPDLYPEHGVEGAFLVRSIDIYNAQRNAIACLGVSHFEVKP